MDKKPTDSKKKKAKIVPIIDPGDWRGHLMRTRMKDGTLGAILPTHFNASAALEFAPVWTGVLAFNELLLQITAVNPTPWGFTGLWDDDQDTRTAIWMQEHSIQVGKNTVHDAVSEYSRRHRFHPVRDYLEALQWDGIPRLDDWLTLYLGCKSSDYVRAVASRWLIGAVARIFRPGCKMDTMLVLEGPQGKRKSSAIRALAPDWFTDDMAELGSKDSAMQTLSVWIIELAELNSMSGRADLDRVKAFISRSTDRFRWSYDRYVREYPRQCVFAGSVNNADYLRDESGGRRFWPVEVGKINLDSLERDRDQIWAEAIGKYRKNAVWWLETEELETAAQDQQNHRFNGDPWEPLLVRWIDGRDSITITEILKECIGKPNGQMTQIDQNRVSRMLTSMGWIKYLQWLSYGDKQVERRWKPGPGANRV